MCLCSSRLFIHGCLCSYCRFFFFFNDTATTEIYTLSLHDALPISVAAGRAMGFVFTIVSSLVPLAILITCTAALVYIQSRRSEEHTSELQSRLHLVCRLLLEKKKKYNIINRNVPIGNTDRRKTPVI